MATTFAELGIAFPLFEAPVDASDYVGTANCCICQTDGVHCFPLGIGTAVMIPCSVCGVVNALDIDSKASIRCRECGETITFPASVVDRKEPKTCYQCLRAGKVALTKDTEFGMVSWDQAFSGVTNGIPGLQQDQFESVMINAEEDWVGVKLPQDIMFELLRTPKYRTWQGERWLFCCRYPMTYLGEWHHDQFNQRASDGNGESLYYAALEDVPDDTWDSLGHAVNAYVFECKQCGRLRAHWDFD
ncbi:MAG: CbrC family protein [Planctomycetaceae bacterium]|nr:CbrC family protein [Planctomycetaceae bacterium]